MGNCEVVVGNPIIRVMALAVGRNTWVMMETVGIPSLSISIPSCTLHELQDPQSPIPVISTSTWSRISWTVLGLVGREALCLLR